MTRRGNRLSPFAEDLYLKVIKNFSAVRLSNFRDGKRFVTYDALTNKE